MQCSRSTIKRHLHANSANVELLIVDGVGHTLHWERPQRFVDELLRFVR